MELIDRRKLVSDFWKGVEDGSILSYEDTDDLMEKAPTVDAVEVVQCKDCIRGRTEYHTRAGEVTKCSLFRHDDTRQYKDPMDYCSNGVRKDREGK